MSDRRISSALNGSSYSMTTNVLIRVSFVLLVHPRCQEDFGASSQRAWRRRWRRSRGRIRNVDLRVRGRAPKHLGIGFRQVIGRKAENTGVAAGFQDFSSQIFERIVTHHPETRTFRGLRALGSEAHAAQGGLLGLLLPGTGNRYEPRLQAVADRDLISLRVHTLRVGQVVAALRRARRPCAAVRGRSLRRGRTALLRRPLTTRRVVAMELFDGFLVARKYRHVRASGCRSAAGHEQSDPD